MTAGYSGTPLAKKLGIAGDTVVATVGAPANVATGITEDTIRAVALPLGFVRLVLSRASAAVLAV
jgi:hypothetical protein